MVLIRAPGIVISTSKFSTNASIIIKLFLPFHWAHSLHTFATSISENTAPPLILFNSFHALDAPTQSPRQALLLFEDTSQEQLGSSGWMLDSGNPE